MQRLAAISSPSLDARAMVQVAEEKGLLTDPDFRNKVEGEFEKSAKDKAETAKQKALAGDPGAGGRIAPPQSDSTRRKKKARDAGKKADEKQTGKNPGGLRP